MLSVDVLFSSRPRPASGLPTRPPPTETGVSNPTLNELREQEADELAAVDNILELCVKDNRVDSEGKAMPNPEETKRIKTSLARVKDFRAQIDNIEEARALLEEQENARERQRQSAKDAALRPAETPDDERPGRSADDRPRAPATARDKDKERKFNFRHIGEQLLAIQQAKSSNFRVIDPRLKIGAATGASSYLGEDGAFLLAPEFAEGVWSGIMRDEPLNLIARCRQMQLSRNSVKVNADAETSEADGSRHGGVRGYWLEEGGTMTASRPKFRQMEIRPKKLGILTYATEELLEDATALGSWYDMVALDELNYMSNRAIVRGTGAGQPLGILNSGGITSVGVETGQTSANPLLPANIDKIYSRLNPDALMGAVWLINPGLRPYLDGLNQEVGTGGVPVYRPPGGVNESPFGTIKGLPLLPCKWCSAYNTQGDIILANLQGYLVATRGGVRQDDSIHVAFTTDEIAFRWIFRIDGQPMRASPVTHEFAASGETFADFVLLDTRS